MTLSTLRRGPDPPVTLLRDSEETTSKTRTTKYRRYVDSPPRGPNLRELKTFLPKEVFEKNVFRSLFWMGFDFAMILGGLKLLVLLSTLSLNQNDDNQNQNHLFHNFFLFTVFRLTLRLLLSLNFFLLTLRLLLSLWTGFFMWALFVVGHDCGHGTFSNSPCLNFVCGLLTHGFLLVPFAAWARSHRMHHLHHNHVVKDYSFPWTVKKDVEISEENLKGVTATVLKTSSNCSSTVTSKFTDSQFGKLARSFPKATAFFYPWIGYGAYLLLPGFLSGMDGCHYLPAVFPTDRMWRDCSGPELLSSWVSVLVVAGYLYGFFFLDLLFDVYLPCWLVFCFMLFTVTYLQHHGDVSETPTEVYDDSTWSYAHAAFETVDRRYGRLIPNLTGGRIDFVGLMERISSKSYTSKDSEDSDNFKTVLTVNSAAESESSKSDNSSNHPGRYSTHSPPAFLGQLLNLDIDVLHHHISDCHVVHHLFFTGIPHYNLPKATEYLKKYCTTDSEYNYKFEDTPDFAGKVVELLARVGTKARLVVKRG